MMLRASTDVITIPSRTFVVGCFGVALGLLVAGQWNHWPVWLLAAEVLTTIAGLFLLGSFRFQVHKNAITYGMSLVVMATFAGLETSGWHREIQVSGLKSWATRHVLSFEGLDELIHADTMLFILGLTYFVAVIAQTRLLEGITMSLIKRYRGAVVPTVIAVTAVVAVASGVLDGVSMIGLMIRTLVIVMLLAAAPVDSIRYVIMMCTAVTTICGAWLAYGEPPNLIMKANLHPHLDNVFFLLYCAPFAMASYGVIAWNLRRRLGARSIDLAGMDVLDAKAADVRFLQAMRHGEVMTSIELVEGHVETLGVLTVPVLERLRAGEPLGLALIRADVPQATRRLMLGHYTSDELADGLDNHYIYDNAGLYEQAMLAELTVDEVLSTMAQRRKRAQVLGGLATIPFACLLIVHGMFHEVPLFIASFAGFLSALPAIWSMPRMRRLALRDARHEFSEYYFLFPLFMSITLLTAAGFFDSLQSVVQSGIQTLGRSHFAYVQFLGSTVLSAILDNNVAADFASRALEGLDLTTLRLFAAAQIAGYALGGCWTHIGCAQSVVAYAFISRDIDEGYTPVSWIRDITPVIVQLLVVITVVLYAQSAVVSFFVEG